MSSTYLHKPNDHASAPSIVQIQIMSDLHLETPQLYPQYSEYYIDPKAPYLALLGDIGTVTDDRLFGFLERQLHQFEIVFYVFGNHEPYHMDSAAPEVDTSDGYDEALAKMNKFSRTVCQMRLQEQAREGEITTGSFVFLDKMRFDISNDVTILGCTLFSRISEEQKRSAQLFITDFSVISGWNTALHNAWHADNISWLNEQVKSITEAEPHRRIAIFTHYSPTLDPRANDPEHLEDSRGVQSAFVTDLSKEPSWTSGNVKLWAFGHTHFNCDYVEEESGKRVLANQRGYGREDRFDFDENKIVDV